MTARQLGSALAGLGPAIRVKIRCARWGMMAMLSAPVASAPMTANRRGGAPLAGQAANHLQGRAANAELHPPPALGDAADYDRPDDDRLLPRQPAAEPRKDREDAGLDPHDRAAGRTLARPERLWRPDLRALFHLARQSDQR